MRVTILYRRGEIWTISSNFESRTAHIFSVNGKKKKMTTPRYCVWRKKAPRAMYIKFKNTAQSACTALGMFTNLIYKLTVIFPCSALARYYDAWAECCMPAQSVHANTHTHTHARVKIYNIYLYTLPAWCMCVNTPMYTVIQHRTHNHIQTKRVNATPKGGCTSPQTDPLNEWTHTTVWAWKKLTNKTIRIILKYNASLVA